MAHYNKLQNIIVYRSGLVQFFSQISTATGCLLWQHPKKLVQTASNTLVTQKKIAKIFSFK
jgi:hypothetical protein